MRKKTKFFMLIVGGVIYSLFFYYIAFGQEKGGDADTPIFASFDNIFSSMLVNILGADTPDFRLKIADLFSDLEAGSHLYVYIYQKLTIEPEKEAFKSTASSFGLTLVEANQVKEGSPTPFFNQEQSVNFTQAQAFNRVNRFQQQYRKNLEALQLQAELLTEYASSEIFYNEELSDSGFDLVYDLNIIEKILFNETSASPIEGDLTGGLPALSLDKINPSENPNIPSPNTGYDKTQSPLTEDHDKSLSPEEELQKAEEIKKNAKANHVPTYAFSGTLPNSVAGDLTDPTYCATDLGLAEAMSEAPTNVGADSGGGAANQNTEEDSSEDSSENKSKVPKDKQEPAPKVEDEEKDAETLQKELESLEKYYDEIKTAETDTEWENPQNCFFISETEQSPICIEINFKYKTVGLYTPGETCIACEINKIKDNLHQTLKNNLSPSKAPGNILEPGKCKTSVFTSPSLNFILLWKPIPTAVKDDLIATKDIVGRWNEFKKLYKPGWFTDDYSGDKESPVSDEDKEKQEEEAANRDIYDEAAEQALALATSGAPQETLHTEINKIVNKSIAEIQANVKEFNESGIAAEFGEFYQIIGKEMETMQGYLAAYKIIFDDIAQKTCPAIKNKSEI